MREMRDSGIPWIGEIPKCWTIELIGNQVKEVDNPNTNGEECNALQFKMGTIISKSQGNSKYNPETLEGYNIVDKGVIMLNGLNLSFDLISQRVGLVRERGVITSTYLAVKPTDNIDSEYLTYLFKAYDNCKAFHSMGKGLRQTLSYGELRKYLLIYPSLAEQQRIAEFLDRKCAEVDEMIALQEQIIEELKAYKQSVITEAVTKGLNPAAPMRDSGIEWIGYTPCHWERIYLKWKYSFEKGKNAALYTQEYIGGHKGEYPVYSGQTENNGIMGLIDSYEYDVKECLFTTTVGAKVMTPKILQGKFSLSQNCLIMHKLNESICNGFVFYLLHALFAYEKTLIPSYMQPSLRVEDLKTYIFYVPPITEQQAIADCLDDKCADIDSLIQTKQSKIDSLKEYKKSIIYEYVTGKREVE